MHTFSIIYCVIPCFQIRDTIETAYHDLVTILYFLREAEINEDLHEHANFKKEIQELKEEIMSLLCRFQVIDSLYQVGIPPKVTAKVVPPEVSNLNKKSMRRQRDYVVINHLDRLLHQLGKDLYILLEDFDW